MFENIFGDLMLQYIEWNNFKLTFYINKNENTGLWSYSDLYLLKYTGKKVITNRITDITNLPFKSTNEMRSHLELVMKKHINNLYGSEL